MALAAKRMLETYSAAAAASPATFGKRRLERMRYDASVVTTMASRAAGRSLRKRLA
jgi:hypothetical protein